MIPTFTVPTIFWEDKRGSSILMQAQLKNELRLKKLLNFYNNQYNVQSSSDLLWQMQA
ncbi:hypothetical protein J1N35_033256 [Gossypium stocksii]|uniref:Uncharacterized protein n=1 Tax=Gossypium stocksii TaxID=47602 RepID=A0A9D3ZN62_9ROSI|nr:hypothetical protein J1N35_033256 [Gossypium stocksii]